MNPRWIVAGIMVAIAGFGVLLAFPPCDEAENERLTRAAAVEWVGTHMPLGTRFTCQDQAPCGNWFSCDASTPDRTSVVTFECTPDGCHGKR